MEKCPAIYIMTNLNKSTLYVGVTSNLVSRVYEHKHSITGGFTTRYNCRYLVYYEFYGEMIDAIEREKQIKAGSRKKKIALIEKMNPEWRDLYDAIV